MNQIRYLSNDNFAKPLGSTQGVRYSGSPLLKQVDQDLKRLRSQVDKSASEKTLNDNNQHINQHSIYNNNFSNYYSPISSPKASNLNRIDDKLNNTKQHQQIILSPSSEIPTIEITNNQTFRLPVSNPQVVKISSPQSEIMRINSPSKIRVVPTPAELAQAQQQALRIAQMQHIERERQLSRKYQQEAKKQRQQRQRQINQRRQRQEHEAEISKTQLGNYVNNINDKNRKISQLESKINQMGYKITNAENESKRYKIQIQNLKNSNKAQTETSSNTISNLKRQIELLNRDKDRRNIDLENKINKINYSYQQVNATNNRLNREIQNLKRQLEKKSTNSEVNQNVFEDFKVKINQKTLRINELQKELDYMTENRNQLSKRVDELLLNGFQPKKQINLQKLGKQPGAFNEILKLNLEENQTYKTNLTVKEQQIFRLQQLNRSLKIENDNMKNQIEIEKLKRITQLKNTQTTMDIEVQVKQNQINSLNHVISALEQKLKFVVQQDRKKDQFMVTYLKGRAETAEQKQSIDQFFKKFELLSVNTNIAECMKREHLEIQKLKDEIHKMYTERR